MAGAAKVGEHKTSMLQDLEAGRPLELEAVTVYVTVSGGAVAEDRAAGVPLSTPLDGSSVNPVWPRSGKTL